MKIKDFLARLCDVYPTSQGWNAQCPAHEDKTPSLSVAAGDQGGIIVHCHAGCSAEAVVNALGLTLRDLAPEALQRPQTSPTPPPIAVSMVQQMHAALTQEERTNLCQARMLTDQVIDRYRLGSRALHGERRITIPIADVEGIFRDVRCWLPPDKRSPRRAKIIHWGKGYGAARLFPIDQLANDELVLVEGELDALACIAHGIPAITATCGASTWNDGLSAPFRGKQVTILMDADSTGQKGAQKRAESLRRAGAEVRL